MSQDSIADTAQAPPAAPAARGTAFAPGSPERKRATRLPTLTGLRGPAALLVFFTHASMPFVSLRLLSDDKVEHGFYRVMAQVAGLAMPFWFMLSGFILVWSFREKDSVKAFWRRRYVKIVPPYLVGWLLAMVAVPRWPATTPTQGILSFFLLQSWVPDTTTYFSVNNVGWSLSTEAFFYVCFPLLYFVFRRIPAQRINLWLLGNIALIVAVPLVTYAVIPVGTAVVPNEPAHSANYFWFEYVFPPSRLLDFALGMLVARSVVLGRWRNIGMVWSGLLVLASYVAANFAPYPWALRVVCVVPAALLVAAGALADAEGRRSVFSNRAMVWFGEVSFAFYLVHYTVIEVVRSALGTRLFSTPVSFALMAAEFGISLLLAWALYCFVEVPVTRRWSSSRKARAARAAAAPPPAEALAGAPGIGA